MRPRFDGAVVGDRDLVVRRQIARHARRPEQLAVEAPLHERVHVAEELQRLPLRALRRRHELGQRFGIVGGDVRVSQRRAERARMRPRATTRPRPSRASSPSRRRASHGGSSSARPPSRSHSRRAANGPPTAGDRDGRPSAHAATNLTIGRAHYRLAQLPIEPIQRRFKRTSLRSSRFEGGARHDGAEDAPDSASRPCCCHWPSVPHTRFVAGRASSRAAITRTKSCVSAASRCPCRRVFRSGATSSDFGRVVPGVVEESRDRGVDV